VQHPLSSSTAAAVASAELWLLRLILLAFWRVELARSWLFLLEGRTDLAQRRSQNVRGGKGCEGEMRWQIQHQL